MLNFRRLLSRRWLLAVVGLAALFFGLAMLHPYPRQTMFGPKLGGVPLCVCEDCIRQYAHNRKGEQSVIAKVRVWLRGKAELPSFSDDEWRRLFAGLLVDRDPIVRQYVWILWYKANHFAISPLCQICDCALMTSNRKTALSRRWPCGSSRGIWRGSRPSKRRFTIPTLTLGAWP